MAYTNLTEYFRGTPGNHKCPECDQDHDSLAEFKEHLWTHREEDAGGPITPEDRRQKCPHPRCVGRTFSRVTSINEHLLTHTGERSFVCPHLLNWSTGQRVLCGHTSAREQGLGDHRLRKHNYKDGPQTADHPWIEAKEGTLSEAVLEFGIKKAEDHGEVKEEEELDEDDAQLIGAPPAQPAAPTLSNIQIPRNSANVQPQVHMSGNAQAQIHPPANIHLPVGPITNVPGIQHHNVPNHIPHHVLHHRLPNGPIVATQLRAPHAPPPNPMPVILQEGERIVPIVENVRYYHSVPARLRRFHPIYNAYIDVPEYQLGTIRVIRGWRRVRSQPGQPVNGA